MNNTLRISLTGFALLVAAAMAPIFSSPPAQASQVFSPDPLGRVLGPGDAFELRSGNLGMATGCVEIKAINGKATVQGQTMSANHGELKAQADPQSTTVITVRRTRNLSKDEHLSADYKGSCRVYVESGSVKILDNRDTGGGCSNALGLR